MPPEVTDFGTVQTAAAEILQADATIRTLCGRTTDLVREPHTLSEGDLPMLVLLLEALPEASGAANLVIAAAAEDTPAIPATQRCFDLLNRCVDVLLYPAFAAQGVEVLPQAPVYRSIDGDDQMFGFVQVVARPSLRLMQVVIPMLVFTD